MDGAISSGGGGFVVPKAGLTASAFLIDGTEPTFMCFQLGDGVFMAQLQKHLQELSAKSRPISHTNNDKPKNQTLYCCKWPTDGAYYRGLVHGPDDLCGPKGRITYRVSFVDFGNSCSITADDIKELPNHLKHIPPQAVNCCLKGLEKIREIPGNNAGLIMSLFQNRRCKLTFYPNIKAVSLNETQRSEMCIPQWAVSVELDSLNLESFVIGNGLHRSPVQAGAPSVVKQENDRGGKGGGPQGNQPPKGQDGGGPLQDQSSTDLENRINHWMLSSGDGGGDPVPYSKDDVGGGAQQERQAPDGQSKVSSAKGRKGGGGQIIQSDSDDEFHEDFFGSVHSSDGGKKVSNSTQPPTVVFSKPSIPSFVTDGGPYESKVDTTQIRLGTVRPSFPDEGKAEGVGDYEADEVVLSHASDLNRFYLHLVDNKETSKLVTLNQALQEELEGSLQDPEFGELIPELLGGSLVAVKEGGNWLRGEISRSDNGTVTYNNARGDGWCRVQLIDFGDTKFVRREDLRRLPPRLCSTPKIALPCRLAELDVSDNERALEIFRREMDPSKGTYTSFRIIHEEKSTFDLDKHPLPVYIVCDVADPTKADSDAVFIHDILNRSEAAVKPSSRVDPKWNPMTEEYLKEDNQVQVNGHGGRGGGPPDFMTVSKPLRMCKFFRFNGRCVAKERCPYSHVQTGDVFHARQEELMNVVAEGTVVETPHVGAKVYIQITNVRTPEQFWAVMPYGTTDWSKINVDAADSTTDTNPVSSFWSMQKALNEHYDNVSAPNNTILVRMGEVVAARSISEDGGGGEWYRSRVVFVDKREELPPEKRDVEVAFVDFGKTTHVKLSETRKLKQEFLHLPFQAMECGLDGICPSPGAQWSAGAGEFLSQLAETHKGFIAHVRHVGGTDRVTLDLFTPVIKEGQGGESVAKLLRQRRLARRVRRDSYYSADVTYDSGFIPG